MRWVFLATDNIASLTNAHHGRPVFFNLQTIIAAAVSLYVHFHHPFHGGANLPAMSRGGLSVC